MTDYWHGWEACILLSLSSTLLIAMLSIVYKTKYQKERELSKMSLNPHYWSIAQNIILVICLSIGLSLTHTEDNIDFWSKYSSVLVQIECLAITGTVLSLALNFNLLTALIKFQAKHYSCQAEVKRDDHFKNEKKIIAFHILIYFIHTSLRVVTIMVTEFDICTETLIGKILVASDPLATFIIFIVFLASVSRLLHWAKRRQNYLFKKYHVFVLIQSIVILIGILASFFYNVVIFLRHIGLEDLV